MFKLDSVTVSYDHHVAVNSISISFYRSATTVLLGTSGSGKSTILRLLLGLVEPAAGRVFYRDISLSELNLIKVRQEIGFMTQQGGLFPHLTVEENICLMPECLKWKPKRMTDRMQDLFSMTRLDMDLLHRYPHEISGGQRQRAALIRSLMLDPPSILLDEPLGALDPLTRFDLQNDLRRIFKELGKTVILVTHDLHEARFFADIIHILYDGSLLQSGTFDEIVSKPANGLVARFVSAQRHQIR